MKLCFLAGANSIHSYRWIKFFAEAGHDVSWISLAPSIFESLPPGVRYFEIEGASGLFGLLRAAYQVRRIVAELRPDVLHVHSVGTYGTVGLLSGFSPIVATPWGSDVIFGKRSLLKRPFIKGILKKAKLITCDAEHMRDEIDGLGVETDKVHLINFGIDTQRFSPQGKSDAIRQRIGVGDAPTVISLRNFEDVYDIPTLLHAIPLVLKRCPEAHFVIVGKGYLEKDLKELAAKLGIEQSVHFLGFIQNQELPNYLSSMDAYVSTSLSDAGIASSTAEAMACAVPVVITDSGENSRWISDGENGYLVPVSEPTVLADRISQLLENQDLRQKFGMAGRNTILDRNDYFREMAKAERLYAQVANPSSPNL